MSEYHKIQSIFKRDMSAPRSPLIEGDYSTPELEFLANNTWTFTEKVDGTNIRIIFDGQKLSYGGRTDKAQIPAQLVGRLNDVFLPLIPSLRFAFPDGGVLYGEGYGAKIQKGGGNYRADQDFVLFDVKVGDWWLKREAVELVAQQLGIDVVPMIGEGTLQDAVRMAKSGIKSTWGDFEAEGIVARPKVEMFSLSGERIITKIKCRDFRAG